MKCNNCGKEIDNPKSKFCKYCGSKIENETIEESLSTDIPPASQAVETGTRKGVVNNQLKSKPNKRFFIILGAASVVLIFILSFSIFKIYQSLSNEDANSSNLRGQIYQIDNNDDITDDPEIDEEINIEGFTPGTFSANYNMKLRAQAAYNAQEVNKLQKGQSVRIINLTKSENDSIWGETSEHQWICIKDPDCDYLTRSGD